MHRSVRILVLTLTCCRAHGEGGGRPADDGDSEPTSQPTVPDDSGTPTVGLHWVSVEASYSVGCGLLSDGRVVCWSDEFVPSDIADVLGPVVAIDVPGAGLGDVCGLTIDGKVRCSCLIDFNGDSPVCEDAPRAPGFLRVRHGAAFACAEDSEHRLTCWGSRGTPEPPTDPVLDWSIETDGGCAVLLDGHVTCWGDIGFESSTGAASEPPPALKYTQVAVGRNHACALDQAGEAHCWGSTWGRTIFPSPTPGPWDRIVAWNQVACGIRADGSAECWHEEEFVPGLDDPWEVPDEQWQMLGLGEWSACGLTLDGRAVCFPAAYEIAGEQHPPSLDELE